MITNKGWCQEVKEFAAKTPQKSGFHFVPEVCALIAKKTNWPAKKVIEYLKDHIKVTESSISFHRKWASSYPEMKIVAGLEKKETDAFKKLIKILEKYQKRARA